MERPRSAAVRHSRRELSPDHVVTLSAHDVAAELRSMMPEIGTVQLHKMLYYAQGLHVTWTGEPLFFEDIEAWTMGPVVASLWVDERHGRPRPVSQELSGDQRELLAAVVDRFGSFSGTALIRRTHQEAPWRDASELETDEPNPVIPTESLRTWFSQSEEYQEHLREADRLRKNRAVYSFTGHGPEVSDGSPDG